MSIDFFERLASTIFNTRNPSQRHSNVNYTERTRSSKKKYRRVNTYDDSVRGSFVQFMDATQFLRNTVKYIFIIWALVLGVYMLFYIASRAALHQQAPEATTQMAKPAEQSKPVNAANNPGSDSGVNIDEQPAAANAQQTPAPATDAVTNSSEVVDTTESQATNSSEKKPADLALKLLTVTAYRAELFDAIDSENAKTIPLLKDSQVLFIERQGEWIKVTTTDSKETGYVHSSQVASN